VGYVLAAVALVLTWSVFRLERFARQQSAISAARSVLQAVLSGMVAGFGEQPGWGEMYFGDPYTPVRLQQQASEAQRVVFHERRFAQVLEVPTQPVAAVATAAYPADLLLEQTRFAANTALWRLRVFNQLVGVQTSFNTRHAVEVANADTPPQRLHELAEASARIALMLHGDGIGHAGAHDGWYGALKDSLQRNVRHLDDLRGFRWSGYRREPLLALADLAVLAAFAAAVAHAA
jgi:hypothetical protein